MKSLQSLSQKERKATDIRINLLLHPCLNIYEKIIPLNCGRLKFLPYRAFSCDVIAAMLEGKKQYIFSLLSCKTSLRRGFYD